MPLDIVPQNTVIPTMVNSFVTQQMNLIRSLSAAYLGQYKDIWENPSCSAHDFMTALGTSGVETLARITRMRDVVNAADNTLIPQNKQNPPLTVTTHNDGTVTLS